MTRRTVLQATAHVLAVHDCDASARWWVETLGFDLFFQTPGFAFVRRGACEIRLGSCPDDLAPSETGCHSYFAYVMVDSVDSLLSELHGRDVEISFPPTDQPWGVREVGLRNPDGHRIMFASVI
jgi:uncharacterized glyoxalase superfamily protein PhnB